MPRGHKSNQANPRPQRREILHRSAKTPCPCGRSSPKLTARSHAAIHRPRNVLSRIDRLELEARQFVEGYLSGKHRSPRHGFAVEFSQHREYVPGDDIKHVDWKVYGRTERYFLKQYEQETNLVAWFVIDASESMQYASGERTKYDLACTAAASMAYFDSSASRQRGREPGRERRAGVLAAERAV